MSVNIYTDESVPIAVAAGLIRRGVSTSTLFLIDNSLASHYSVAIVSGNVIGNDTIFASHTYN